MDQPKPSFLHGRAEWIGAVVMLGVFVAALYTLTNLAHEIPLPKIIQAFAATSWFDIALSIIATLASYGVMILYDYGGLRYVGIKLPMHKIAPVSFSAFGIGNTLGFGWLSSGAVRYRLYSAFGVPPEAIAKIIGFIAFGFGMGVAAVGGIGLLLEAGAAAPLLHVSSKLLVVSALIFLGLMATLFFWASDGRELRIGRHAFRLPSAKLLLWQLPISIVDVIAAAIALWVLLPDNINVDFAAFASFYSLALVLGVVSHVPGGLGVFESVMLFLLGDKVPTADLLAALLGYRVIYYLLPFLLSLGVLALSETRALRRTIADSALFAGWRRIAPSFLAVAIFILGVILLASGVIPAGRRQLSTLNEHLPLFLQEGAHFLASLAGLALIILAQGLRWRSNMAWALSCVVVAINVPLSLAKGLAIGESLIFAIALGLLLSSRRAFYRNAHFLSVPFSPRWWIASAATLYGMIWLLFFAYKHVEYNDDLWWQFASMAEAPRSLRAAIGVAVASAIWGLTVLLRPSPRVPDIADRATRERAMKVAMRQPFSEACLANLGDKNFLFSETGNSFIMYGAQGRSWIALFDPIGDKEEAPELIWRFREMTDLVGARPVFYEVSTEFLPVFIDAGFSVQRLGEHALVDLDHFDLTSAACRDLRQTYNRGVRDGLAFEIVDTQAVPAILPQLKQISDAWLEQHQAKEKGFSLGRFDADYISSQPVGVVKLDGVPIAFATFMRTNLKEEVSVDLMRQLPDIPKSTMDFLFVSLMQHFKEQGYKWFNLGMAPLAGLADNPLAPVWHKLGRRFYLYGERFYNFRGLRAYKSKFNPVWKPRYLVTLSGTHPYMALADVTRLISGGWKGALFK